MNEEVFCSLLIGLISLEWVTNFYLEAKKTNIEFYFHQCSSMFLKDEKIFEN